MAILCFVRGVKNFYAAYRPSDDLFLGHFSLHSNGEFYVFSQCSHISFAEGDMHTIQKSLMELNLKLRTERHNTKKTDNLHQTVADLTSRVDRLEGRVEACLSANSVLIGAVSRLENESQF